MNIVLNDIKFRVYNINEVKDGVEVSIQNSENGNIAMMSRDNKNIVFELEKCEKVLLGLRE